MAALPAHAVIQYDQALKNPIRLPYAARAYAYGPPSAGSRLDNDANRSASAKAPTVTRIIDNSVIGPYADSEPGRLKIPTPMMLPTISAVACGNPSLPVDSGPADASRAMELPEPEEDFRGVSSATVTPPIHARMARVGAIITPPGRLGKSPRLLAISQPRPGSTRPGCGNGWCEMGCGPTRSRKPWPSVTETTCLQLGRAGPRRHRSGLRPAP